MHRRMASPELDIAMLERALFTVRSLNSENIRRSKCASTSTVSISGLFASLVDSGSMMNIKFKKNGPFSLPLSIEYDR